MTYLMENLISVARGTAPADLLLTNASIINVFNGEIEKGNVAVYAGKIAGIGDYHLAKKIIDIQGRFLMPGLINGHTHIESSMLDIGQYAQAVIPHGTLGVVTDLHEIANVSGIQGLRYILNASRKLPFNLFLMAPSCVPSTAMETSGASINAAELRRILRWGNVIGIGEMMDYPGVINANKLVLDKINEANGLPVDGHAPGLKSCDLNAYISAGISSDHESIMLEEAMEKLSRGLYIMIREGSSEKNLDTLLPLVTDRTYHRCLLVVDDRNCSDLLRDGDIDAVVRKAIGLGLDPVRAVQMASINAAERFGLKNMGALGSGYWADMIVVGNLSKFNVDMVFHHGQLVAASGKPLFKYNKRKSSILTDSFNIKPFKKESLEIKSQSGPVYVIDVVQGQIVTRKQYIKMNADAKGCIQPDISRDILKLVVVERHKGTGNIGRGFIHGFGLKNGALASSISHDSHNIVAVGTNDTDIYKAINEVVNLRGGLAVVSRETTIASLALPVSGLLSDQPLASVVANTEKIEQAAKEIGCVLSSAFATLSFMALPVIPELRLTDMGIADVNNFKIIARY